MSRIGLSHNSGYVIGPRRKLKLDQRNRSTLLTETRVGYIDFEASSDPGSDEHSVAPDGASLSLVLSDCRS